jgi:hypothetical protein
MVIVLLPFMIGSSCVLHMQARLLWQMSSWQMSTTKLDMYSVYWHFTFYIDCVVKNSNIIVQNMLFDLEHRLDTYRNDKLTTQGRDDNIQSPLVISMVSFIGCNHTWNDNTNISCVMWEERTKQMPWISKIRKSIMFFRNWEQNLTVLVTISVAV